MPHESTTSVTQKLTNLQAAVDAFYAGDAADELANAVITAYTAFTQDEFANVYTENRDLMDRANRIAGVAQDEMQREIKGYPEDDEEEIAE